MPVRAGHWVWKVSFWARLKDREHAYKPLQGLLKPTNQYSVQMSDAGGTYPNLFSADILLPDRWQLWWYGGYREMLCRHAGAIELLPAIPLARRQG